VSASRARRRDLPIQPAGGLMEDLPLIQTVTIDFTGRLRPWVPALLTTLSQTP
jgi:hypothetical protein